MAVPLIVPAEPPVGPTRIAARPRKVIVELGIADRDLGPGVEVRTPLRDDDHPGVAGAVGDDRCGRLDDRAARRALGRFAASAVVTEAAMKPLNAAAITGRNTNDVTSLSIESNGKFQAGGQRQ